MPYSTLISVAQLAERLNDPNLVSFDCRHDLMNHQAGRQAYAKAHIPGAHFAHTENDLSGPKTGRTGRHPLPDPPVFMNWLGTNGVERGKQVVAYDLAAGASAARLWWMLSKWLDHEWVAVLDGGWEAWLKDGQPITNALPTICPAMFSGTTRTATVNVQQMLSHLEQPEMVVVDARSNERYRGVTEPIDPVAGHIPGAKNRFYKDNLDANGKFLPSEELRRSFSALLGDAGPERMVHQCGSGITACHNLLAMEIAGLKDSRLYPGSWSEWVADPARPVSTG